MAVHDRPEERGVCDVVSRLFGRDGTRGPFSCLPAGRPAGLPAHKGREGGGKKDGRTDARTHDDAGGRGPVVEAVRGENALPHVLVQVRLRHRPFVCLVISQLRCGRLVGVN